MNFEIARIPRNALQLAVLLLAACSGGGDGTTIVAAPTYTVGGMISGLSGPVVLKNNDSGTMTEVAADGTFAFPTQNADGSSYNVSVFSQPAGQTCSVSSGTGMVSGNNVSNVTVVCSTNAYNVGGNVAGLTGLVELQNNSGDTFTASANGPFTFATPVANGSPYSVTVSTQPSATMTCSVANGTGTIALADVGNVAISCANNTHSVGGTATGLNGSAVLQDNGADNLTVSVNGPFNFPSAVAYGNPYSATIFAQPVNQHCMLNAGAGTVTANIVDIALSCISITGGAVQGTALGLASAMPAVSTLAGAFNGADGIGAAARFNNPESGVSDGTNLYVSDSNNNTIRKIVIATGEVTTLAGQAGISGSLDGTGAAASFSYPAGITLVGGNLYVADMYNQKIRQIVIATGAVTTLAGSGWWGGVDGVGAGASFTYLRGIASDGTNLYVADMYNLKIRQIAIATGAVTTLAGSGGFGAVDGVGVAASFGYPQGIASDGTNLYVADTSNNKIRKIVIATGAVTTLAGTGVNGAVDGAGAVASFSSPQGITTDGTNLYVADANNNKIRQVVIATGAVSSLTGVVDTASAQGLADGAAASATFVYPQGISSDGNKLYVLDSGNSVIRTIATATGIVSTLAGASTGVDGIGAYAGFSGPNGIATDGINLYVADQWSYTIRKIVIATGAVTTLAGQAGQWGTVDGMGSQARFATPGGITTDGTNLYVTDQDSYTIRQIVIATGAVTTLAGSGNWGYMDGTGSSALFSGPAGIVTDGVNLYVVDQQSNTIRKIVIATRAVTTLAGANAWGAADGIGAAARFNSPDGITTDGTNLYVADTSNNKIRKIVIATGAVTTLAGTGVNGAVDGAGVSATFNGLRGITSDGVNLYVADTNNNKIRKIEIATGLVSSVTGVADVTSLWGGLNGTGDVARFDGPVGITTDGTSLYVTDNNNNAIRKLQ